MNGRKSTAARPVDLDFESRRWSADREFAEGDFPLIATVRGKRYELYSDGTFDEETPPLRYGVKVG